MDAKREIERVLSKITAKKVKKIKKSKIEGKISKETSTGAATEKTEVLGTVIESEPMCNVGISGGFTRNIGNYNSVKIQVSLHIPCAEDDIESTFDYIQDWVDEKMGSIWDEYDESDESEQGRAEKKKKARKSRKK